MTSRLRIKTRAVFLSELYFCSGSLTWCTGYNQYDFGEGTELAVLEHGVRKPKVDLFHPSAAEIREKKKATVVCLVSNFYPDNIQISWLVDDQKHANGPNVHTDPNSIATANKTSYSISSRLRLEDQQWAQSKRVECQVSHYANGITAETQNVTLAIKAEICGITEESKIQSMGAAKLTYLIVLCKSILYAIFVSTCVWKTKTSYGKRFD